MATTDTRPAVPDHDTSRLRRDQPSGCQSLFPSVETRPTVNSLACRACRTYTRVGVRAAAGSAVAFLARPIRLLKRILKTFSIWLKKPGSLLLSLMFTWVHMLCIFGSIYIFVDDLGTSVSFWMIAGIWSLTYFTDPRNSALQCVARRVKDTAFFGLRALWT